MKRTPSARLTPHCPPAYFVHEAMHQSQQGTQALPPEGLRLTGERGEHCTGAAALPAVERVTQDRCCSKSYVKTNRRNIPNTVSHQNPP
jgi:hypothetical protein